MSHHISLDFKVEVPAGYADLLYLSLSPVATTTMRKVALIHSAVNTRCQTIAQERRQPTESENMLFTWANSLSYRYPFAEKKQNSRSYTCWKCNRRYASEVPAFGYVCRIGTGCRANDIMPSIPELVGRIIEYSTDKPPKDPYTHKPDGGPSASNAAKSFKLRPYADFNEVGYDDPTGDDICADVLPMGITRRKV